LVPLVPCSNHTYLHLSPVQYTIILMTIYNFIMNIFFPALCILHAQL
jgi:hypothetical protein